MPLQVAQADAVHVRDRLRSRRGRCVLRQRKAIDAFQSGRRRARAAAAASRRAISASARCEQFAAEFDDDDCVTYQCHYESHQFCSSRR